MQNCRTQGHFFIFKGSVSQFLAEIFFYGALGLHAKIQNPWPEKAIKKMSNFEKTPIHSKCASN